MEDLRLSDNGLGAEGVADVCRVRAATAPGEGGGVQRERGSGLLT